MTRGLGSWDTRGETEARPEPETERGFTLIEMLIGIVLLGGIVVGMMGTLFTVTAVSDEQRQQALVEAEGRRLTEKIHAIAYQQCALPEIDNADGTVASPSDYDEAIDQSIIDPNDPSFEKVTFKVTDIQWGTPDGDLTTAWTTASTTAQTTCLMVGAHKDCGRQQLTIRASTPDGYNTSFVVFKRADAPIELWPLAC